MMLFLLHLIFSKLKAFMIISFISYMLTVAWRTTERSLSDPSCGVAWRTTECSLSDPQASTTKEDWILWPNLPPAATKKIRMYSKSRVSSLLRKKLTHKSTCWLGDIRYPICYKSLLFSAREMNACECYTCYHELRIKVWISPSVLVIGLNIWDKIHNNAFSSPP